jgi:hypothetical protein
MAAPGSRRRAVGDVRGGVATGRDSWVREEWPDWRLARLLACLGQEEARA